MVAELLVANNAEYTIRDMVWLGDTKRIDALLKSDPTLANDVSGVYREAVLFTAGRGGHSRVVQLLLGQAPDLTCGTDMNAHHCTLRHIQGTKR